MPNRKLGKKPARENSITFKLASYLDTSALPPTPPVFGHQSLQVSSWGMLGNDNYGDCVEAGSAHETMLWGLENSNTVYSFTDQLVLKFYSDLTGFSPDDPNSDQGTDMQQAVAYRQKTGFKDAAGNVHKIGPYLALKAGDVNELATAVYLFSAVGFGFNFPESADAQFDQGKPWDVVKGSQIVGGHYVPVIGRLANGNFVCVTWGQLQEMTPAFVKKYNDESFVALSPDFVTPGTGTSIDGFAYSNLVDDLSAIGSGVVNPPTPPAPPVPPVPPTPPAPPEPDLIDKIVDLIETCLNDIKALFTGGRSNR